MNDYKICYGSSRNSIKWKNSYVKWSDFIERLKNTVRTSETVEEYAKLPKGSKDKIKDIGGFVAGHISGERRKKENVLSRSMITLDMDEVTNDFLANKDKLPKYKWLIYSTHKHKPEAPRLRFIIPLSRDISPEEYGAVSRMIAKDLGMDMMDKSTFEVNRMMYWPSTSINGVYVFEVNDGEILNPDEILNRYDDWHDVSTWPKHKSELEVVKDVTSNKKQDPLGLDGVVGAFCRCYSISAVIEKYLNDVYEPTSYEDRYDYIPADSSAGVIVYDDKFIYSHHATDPASGKLMNAFEIVMAHKFKDLSEKMQFKEMCKFALEDENVRIMLTEEKEQMARDEFKDDEVTCSEQDSPKDNKWKGKLKLKENGEVENLSENLVLILQNDKDFANFAYNEMARMVEIVGQVPWKRGTTSSFWTDLDTSQLKCLLDKRYGEFTNRNHEIAFDKVVTDRHFHPVRDYLNTLSKWDGVKRIDDLFIKYMQAEDSDYIRTVTRKSFVAMVARILEPGIKFDAVPVLDGAQGIGKSTIVRDLIGEEYYSDALSLTDMSDKTGAEKLQGFWCVEIGELAGMKKADIEKVKAFVTTQCDNYRPSYGRVVESHPRQCVVIATINGENGYLRDITGNRRFWIIKLKQTEKKRTWSFDKDFKDQFWAEAMYYYNQGEKLYLEGDIAVAAEKHQMEAMEQDNRLGMVLDYLDKLLPENWNNMTLYERRNFLDGDALSPKGTIKRTSVSCIEIFSECFGCDPTKITRSDSFSIAAIMMQIPGWKKVNKTKRLPIYGPQKYYERT